GPGGLCEEFGECSFLGTLDACPDMPLVSQIPVSAPGDEEIVSLSFVDANGDAAQDLVIGTAQGATLMIGPGGAEPAPLPVKAPVHTAVSGDFNGDGSSDLVVADTSGVLTFLLGDGTGTFTVGNTFAGAGPLDHLHVIEWNDDGNPDLVAAVQPGDAVIHFGDGLGGIGSSATVGVSQAVTTIATGRFDEGPLDDLVIDQSGQAGIYLAPPDGDLDADAPLEPNLFLGPRLMDAADFDGGGVSDVAASTNMFEWVMLEAWRDGNAAWEQYALFLPELSHIATGDIDGNGLPELLLHGGTTLTMVRGMPMSGPNLPPLDCQGDLGPVEPATSFAVGDLTGDGAAEVVMAVDSTLTVLSVIPAP
nr:VCBS repeat-containing protein [Deltaproteobacteria bacterium]